MRCPKCGTENDKRTICSNCGFFMYRADLNNRARMTKKERQKEDLKEVGKKFGKVFKVIWMILMMLAMSFWILALLTWLITR